MLVIKHAQMKLDILPLYDEIELFLQSLMYWSFFTDGLFFQRERGYQCLHPDVCRSCAGDKRRSTCRSLLRIETRCPVLEFLFPARTAIPSARADDLEAQLTFNWAFGHKDTAEIPSCQARDQIIHQNIS